MPDLEGKTLDRYELKQLVGKGGMADVYKGYDPSLEQEIAVKVFKHEEEQMLLRFIREARFMRSLSNAHLVPIYDFRSSRIGDVTWYYIIMPFMHGGTLRDRISRAPLSLSDTCDILDAIADALDYVHTKGIVHRDIKSSNVLLDAEGRYYLSDFGIARSDTDEKQLTNTGDFLGTFGYVAPELFNDANRKADVGSDLYSLGVLLFEIVTGRLPFSTENLPALIAMHINTPPPVPSSIASHIPPSVDEVIRRALAKRPEQRYASATALANAFRRAVFSEGGTKPIHTHPVGNIVPPIDMQEKEYTPTAPVHILQPVQDGRIILQPHTLDTPRPGTQTLEQFSKIVVPPILPQNFLLRKGRRALVITIAALIALLIIIFVPIVVVAITSSPGGPTLNPTATAQARATATAGPLATAIGRIPSYAAALNNSNSAAVQAAHWDVSNSQNNSCFFSSDGYRVTQITTTINLQACGENAYQYGNATISVDVKILSGDSGGLFLRFQNKGSQNYIGYMFEINSKGQYKFSYFRETNPLLNWTNSLALKMGIGVTNTITVIMKYNTFALYANGSYLKTVMDPNDTYKATDTDNLALFASAPDADTDVAFSNLQVWQLS